MKKTYTVRIYHGGSLYARLDVYAKTKKEAQKKAKRETRFIVEDKY
jgi:hypothetical protein